MSWLLYVGRELVEILVKMVVCISVKIKILEGHIVTIVIAVDG